MTPSAQAECASYYVIVSQLQTHHSILYLVMLGFYKSFYPFANYSAIRLCQWRVTARLKEWKWTCSFLFQFCFLFLRITPMMLLHPGSSTLAAAFISIISIVEVESSLQISSTLRISIIFPLRGISTARYVLPSEVWVPASFLTGY